MTIERLDDNKMRLTAEVGRAIHEIGTNKPTMIIGAIVNSDRIDCWEDCEFGQYEPSAE